jgi:hypothetical protein
MLKEGVKGYPKEGHVSANKIFLKKNKNSD